ncbi:MAG TPA: hypothetical protein VGH80_14810 [Xanthomonadaceae bacterium]|jgi:hypothetical protein
MKSRAFPRKHGAANLALACAILLCASLASAPACARTLDMRVDSLQSATATASGLRLLLMIDDSAQGGRLRIDADRVDTPNLGYAFRDVHWECPLVRDKAGAWQCQGDVRAGKAKPMRLAVTVATATMSARLSDGASAATVQSDAKTPDTTRLLFEQVPAAWLDAYVASLGAKGHLQKGRLDAQLVIRSPSRTVVDMRGPLRLRGFALETPDGSVATDALDADVRLAFNRNASQRKLAIDADVHGGELLAGGLYAALPKTPITAGLRAQQAGNGDWTLSALDWKDGAVLTASGGARWSPTQGLRTLDLQLQSRDLAIAHDRYLTGWLDPAGFAGLKLHGEAQADIALGENGWRSGHARLQGVDAIDGKQRFELHGLAGDLRWTADAVAVDSALHWNSGALFGIALGPAPFALRSQSRHIALSAPAGIPMLGGTLRLDRFDLVPPTANSGARFVLGLSLLKLEVAQIARVLGWPAFGGTLDGNLPSAHYADNVLDFDGALNAQVFGGKLAITRLAMERPFGDDPSVNVDLDIDDFDLKTLTSLFGFGQISGRLDGSIRGLRLLDWTPVAFDAQLRSDDKAPDSRRISQRAIVDLSDVGGSGIAAGLQSQALRLFQDFGYARLGLSCKLANDVCRMGGIEKDTGGSAGAGYTIVEGSGLPHISVIGFERQVDWPTLVARLKAATQGHIVVK